jgi:hypothetical protein
MSVAASGTTIELAVAPTALTTLRVGMEEGLLLSRLSSEPTLYQALPSLTGLSADRVAVVVSTLLQQNIVRVHGAIDLPLIMRPEDLADGKDLDGDQKKAIFGLHSKLPRITHYELLGIARNASADAVKDAYLAMSRRYHPDAFFRRDIGGYAARISDIFRALKHAYSVLGTAAARKEYDATLPPLPVAPAPVLSAEEREREERHQARMREARLKKNPVLDRVAKAREIWALANTSLEDGRFDEAMNHARLVASFEPGRQQEVDALISKALDGKQRMSVLRLEAAAKQGRMDGDLTALVDLMLTCSDGALRTRCARALLTLKQGRLAYRLATHGDAQRIGVSMWEVAAEAAALDEHWPLVQKAAERWQQLEPSSTRAKQLFRLARSRA